jgi:hypothetical protein
VLRNSIANTPQPDAASPPPVPQSEAEWLAVIGEREKGSIAQVPVIAEQLSVSFEQNEIEGVNRQNPFVLARSSFVDLYTCRSKMKTLISRLMI